MAKLPTNVLGKNSELGSLFFFLHRQFRTGLLLLLSTILVACEKPPRKVVVSGPIMGTTYRVTAVVMNGARKADSQQINTVALAAMERVNQSMSTYLAESELSQINRLAANTTVVVSKDLGDVLAEALAISELSGGYFDATVGKAIRLWGFAEDGKIVKQPSAEVLRSIRSQVGYRNIEFDGQQLSKLNGGVEINLSAIAKGYAVDKVAEALDGLGLDHYLIDIGGELRAKGVNADGDVWRVGVEKPHVTGGVAQIIRLADAAIATSGDYRNFIEIDGERFSHTIDPKTLRPIYHRLASVSVISAKASTADAMATAILAMGEDKGRKFAEKNGLAAYFIVRDPSDNSFKISMTNAFRPYLQN